MKAKSLFCAVLIIVLSVQFFAVFPIHEVHATTYFSDTFELFSTLWDATYTTSGGTIAKSSTVAHGGTYSVKVSSTASGSYAMALKYLTIGAVNVHTSVWIYVNSSYTGDNDICLFSEYNDPHDLFVPECVLKYHDSAYYLRNRDWYAVPNVVDICTITADAWHQVEAYYNYATGTIHYYVDGVLQAGSWNSAGVGLAPTSIFIGDTDSTPNYESGLIYLDDLVIDNAADPSVDVTAPTYASVTTSTTYNGTSCAFGVTLTDDNGLATTGGYIFGGNWSGTWINDTWTAFSGNPQTISTVKVLSLAVGDKDEFEWWANDTSNNWNSTGIQTVTTTLKLPYFEGTSSDWPMSGYNSIHRGGYGTTSLVPSTTLWTYKTGAKIIVTQPAVADGVLYVGCDDYNVYALNASTGGLIWTYATGGWVRSKLAVVGNVVFVTSQDKNVYALNATTGLKIWNYTISTGPISPSVIDGFVYFGSDGGVLYALNASTATLVWQYDSTGSLICDSPEVADDVLYVGVLLWNSTTFVSTEVVVALNASTGAQKWNVTTWSHYGGSPYSLWGPTLTVADGIVYSGSDDSITKMFALNAMTGATIWDYTTGDFQMDLYSACVVTNDIVYVVTLNNTLPAHNGIVWALNATTGALIWNYGLLYHDCWATPAVIADVVYITGLYDVIALNASTGALFWSRTMPATVRGSPSVVNNILYFGCDDGNVYALGPVSPPIYVTNDPNTLNLIFQSVYGLPVDGITVTVSGNETQAPQVTTYGAVNFNFMLYVGPVTIATEATSQYQALTASFDVRQGANVYELTLQPVGGGADWFGGLIAQLRQIPAWAIWALIIMLIIATILGVTNKKRKGRKKNGNAPERAFKTIKKEVMRR